jgi:hypothetical protein
VHVNARLDESQHWYNSSIWHRTVFVGTIVGGMLARKFLDAPMYFPSQMRSPSKLYHDFIIYCGFGYLMVTTCVSALFGTPWSDWKFAVVGSVALWVFGLITDRVFTSKIDIANKIKLAHPVSWVPIWK